MDPNKLKQQRKALLDEAEAIAAAAEGENRDLNAEERTAYEGKISAVDALDARIARAEEMQKRQGISTPDAIPGTDIVVPEENRHDNVVPAEELRNYSLYKAIRALVSGDRRGAEFEFEVSDAIATRQDANNGGLLIPLAVLGSEERQVTKANESELIATEHMAGDFIGLLRNRSITAAAGATVLDRLVGDISIPKQTAAGTAYWIGETGPVTSSVQTYGNVALAAKQVAARTLLTRLMAKQSSPAVEGLTREDIVRVLALALDLAALHGTGAANQPLGIDGQVGVGYIDCTTGGLTWARVVQLESEVAADNADIGNLSYATSARGVGYMKSTLKSSGVAGYLLENGNLNGYTCHKSNQVAEDAGPTGNLFFGNWADLLIAIWGEGVEVIVDPYSQAANAQIALTAFLTCDVNVRHAESFAFADNWTM
jgi:HK97 family phage major capsid protein